MRKFPLLKTSIIALACATHAEALQISESILVDFSHSAHTTTGVDDPNGTWNNVTAPSDAIFGGAIGSGADPIPSASNLVRYSDGATTNVSLSVNVTNTALAQINPTTILSSFDASATFSATGAMIPESAQKDFAQGAETNDNVSSNIATFFFNGLNDSLLYDLEFQSWIDSSVLDMDSRHFTAQSGLPSEAVLNVDANDTPSVYRFSGLSTNGAGQISLTMEALGKGGQTRIINAMALTAVPEPSSSAVLFGTVALLLGFARRKHLKI